MLSFLFRLRCDNAECSCDHLTDDVCSANRPHTIKHVPPFAHLEHVPRGHVSVNTVGPAGFYASSATRFSEISSSILNYQCMALIAKTETWGTDTQTNTQSIFVRSWRCGCLVTWFCYQLIAKPGNNTVTPPWPGPYRISTHMKDYTRWVRLHCIGFKIYVRRLRGTKDIIWYLG